LEKTLKLTVTNKVYTHASTYYRS